jgi:hypothetical protein
MDYKLIAVVVFLAIAIGGLLYFRHKTVMEKPELVVPNKKPVEEVKPEITTVQNDRMALMGIVNNNNSAVMRYGYSRQDIIFINEDWTIDRIPPHVQLSKEDEVFVRRFLKRRES